MISFENDYIAGAHPAILQKFIDTNFEALSGYGTDHYCQSAREKIILACQKPEAEVFFLVGGTQTNTIVIASMLDDCEGVIAAETGHINTHEAGAIEYTGHKVLTLPQTDGKLAAADVKTYLDNFYGDDNHSHAVFPGMVYISHPTEYGTLYTKEELSALSQVCRSYEIPLYMDGARLGYGIMSKETDLTLADIAALCDVFYIGGTKVGALCGEAVVFTCGNMPRRFMTVVKRHGGLAAKGRLLGIQFDTLFTDNLYFKISAHAIEMAEKLKEILEEKGYPFYLKSPTNQQFVILTNEQADVLKEKVAYSFWERLDEERIVIRLATSWSTTEEDLSALAEAL